MASRGPKPKPTQMKLVTATARPHRLNPGEPRPVPLRPEPPDHLTEAARLEWDRIVTELFDLGILTDLDRGALAAYCQAYGRWSAAETALARMAEKDGLSEGLMVRTKAGNLIQNPLVGTANKAMGDMVRYAAEFGLTPSARTKVAAVPGEGRAPSVYDEWLA
jgi:P27 family predicted phage terminase small subunit